MRESAKLDVSDLLSEFDGASLGDGRLVQRLRRIVSLAASEPADSFPEQMASVADREALYRFLANPKVKAEYDALAPECEIAAELLRARLRAGLSQADLAARMGTSQSRIARLESGQSLPSTKTLLRYAEATGSKFHVRLSAA